MNNIVKIILVLFCLAGTVSSCDEFLDVTPPSEYTDKNFYQTPADFQLAITSCYSRLQSVYGQNGTGYMNTIMMRGDECRSTSNVGRFMDGATEAAWQRSWSALWKIVYESNKILDKIDGVEFSNQNDKNYIKGEALALRGWCFLQFAWCWGGAPLITKELSLAETYKTPRASQSDNYLQAISDLSTAIDLLPESWDATNLGRVTKYGAAAVLGRLYMYTHDYTQAETFLKMVIDSKKYELQANYDDCFNDAFNNSKERVWEVQYLGGSQGGTLELSQAFCSVFIPSSLNIRSDGPLMNGVTFTGPSGSTSVSQSLSDSSAYETILPGTAKDKRRALTIVNGLRLDKTTPNYDQFFCKKWLKATKTPPSAINYWGNNLPIIRYTDVKMMYAEALNEIDYSKNISDKILPILNEVRARGGLGALTTADLPDKQSTFDYIVRERFVEFCFEGLRWPDLIRWGLAEEAMERHFKLKDEGYNETSQTPAYQMKDYNVLAPIPYSEIISYNNKNIMWQNPGY